MSRKINIRPTTGVYATYRRLSYQPWTAIAEFVDNSTQSFYDHQEELMAQKYAKGLSIEIDYIEDKEHGDRLEICDNAYGMEWPDFQRAVILDKPPQNTNGRNEFGMGLKTAACWFGALWSVESTQLNSRNKYFTEIDIDQLGKYKTEEIEVQEETVSAKEHYTKIIIKRLNKRISGSRTVSKVKELLSSIYRQDLRNGNVKIYYNGNLLQFKEPPVFIEEQNDGQKITWKKEMSFSINHEGKMLSVDGFLAIRIPGSVKDAGLTLMRRGRVIVGGSEKNYRPTELFGDSNSYAYQRLYGELHMDNWPVTQAKDSFDWHNSGLEESFISALEKHTFDYRKKAENIRIREKIRTSILVETAVNDLAKSGLVDDVKFEIVEFEGENKKEVPNIEADDFSDDTETVSASEVVDNKNEGVILEGGSQVEFQFKYKGAEYLFHILLDLSDPTAHWLLVQKELGENIYTLTINMRHSFFKPVVEKMDFLPIMLKMSISLVLAEIETTIISPDPNGKIYASDIRLKMNEILDEVRKGEIKQ